VSQVLIVLLVFLGYSAMAVPMDLYFYNQVKIKKALEDHGVRGVATIVEMSTTMGAIAVSSVTVDYRFEPTPGRIVKHHEVLTSGLYGAHEGDLIDIVYLPDEPEHCQIPGNVGHLPIGYVAITLMNLLWLLLFVSIFLVVFDH